MEYSFTNLLALIIEIANNKPRFSALGTSRSMPEIVSPVPRFHTYLPDHAEEDAKPLPWLLSSILVVEEMGAKGIDLAPPRFRTDRFLVFSSTSPANGEHMKTQVSSFVLAYTS